MATKTDTSRSGKFTWTPGDLVVERPAPTKKKGTPAPKQGKK